ncbi:MAG TPA: hypothetical protein VE397_12060 [Stellaceae bacterium]|jgi:hypothetical protein|nr:hypothetical protein [Stellaceae bacterium]
MAIYSFTMRVSGIDTGHGRYEDSLFKAGCTDALVAVVDGALFLDFDREASSYESAVESARRNVEQAGGMVVSIERASH